MFRDPIGLPFNGAIHFGPLTGIASITLFVSDMGGINDWIIRVQGNGVDIELLARAVTLIQGQTTELLYFPLPRLPNGTYSFQASALSNSALVSNTIQLTIQ